MLSPRHNRMISQFHKEQGITYTANEITIRPGIIRVTTPDGRQWVLVDTELGLWYAIWRGQSLPKVRSKI